MACIGCKEPKSTPKIAVPLRASQACTLIGDPTGVLHECPSCAGNVQVKEFGCSLHGRCTVAKEVDGVSCCRTCNDCKPIQAIDRIRISLPGHHFNCGLIEFQGKMLLASRCNWLNSEIWLHELSNLWQRTPRVMRSVKLNTGHPRSCTASEDPRLFVHQGKLHVAFTGYERREGVNAAHHLYARVSAGDWQVEDVWEASYDRRKAWEKNWATFSHDGEMFAIYSVKPHRILRIDGRRAFDHCETSQRVHFSGGQLRGGASPVLVGDEYYHFFHGWLKRKHEIVYSVGVYTFEAKPPFAMKRFCPDPAFMAEARLRANADIIYPCGAAIRDGVWCISYGFQDQDCRALYVASADVDKVLRPVAAGETKWFV